MKHICFNPLGPDALVQVGPLVNVLLSPSQDEVLRLEAQGLPVPVVNTTLMIDTGAQKTVIDQALANALGIAPIRFEQMVGVSHKPEECPVYLMTVTLGVQDGPNVGNIQFQSEIIGMTSSPIPQAHKGLLGRDFFRHVRLVYDGPSAHVTIEALPGGPIAGQPAPPPPPGHPRKPNAKAMRKAARKARKKNRGQ